jgi:uncharacterized damage-inducible protein DinB
MIHTEKQITEMSLLALMKDYAIYNLWANTQLVEWLKTKPAELMKREVASSFPSINETLHHIEQTQKWWMKNMQQVKEESIELQWGQKYNGAIEDTFNELLNQSKEFVEYANSLNDESLQEECAFAIPYVGDFNRPRFEMIQHCMNHSTYHRGQVITIGRNVGLTDAPMTDYMYYLLMVKSY